MAAAVTITGGPRFAHDCAACTFLGALGEYDLYHCPQHGLPTLIVRRSSKGSDYSSFLASILARDEAAFRSYPVGRALIEAYRLAHARGLPLG